MKPGTIILIIGAVVILVAAYLANGAEKETAWLYIFAIGIVLLSAFGAHSKMGKGKDR